MVERWGEDYMEVVNQSWLVEAMKLVRQSSGGQLTLGGGVAEQRLNSVVAAVLQATALQVERDSQQAIIETVNRVYDGFRWARPNYEGVRRTVQTFQNKYMVAAISAGEKERRLAKEAFVRKKHG